LQKFGHAIGMPNIEHTIDYGWLFFLTKPLHYIFNFLVKQFSSIILALIIISIILKLITWPLTSSSHITMQRMHILSPEIKEIRQRFKDNPQLMNSEIFALYKRQKINPMSSFLPAILQMLMLFPLYKVLSFSIELYQVSFPFWISDLSSKDPTSILNLFGILPFQAPDFFQVGAWPVLMGLTMIIQQMLSSIPESHEQKMMQYIMPIFFTWIMSALPSGVVIYWTLMNVLTILQILYLNIRLKKA
jgi:YidC/Oxa1 family membrane protein insertase